MDANENFMVPIYITNSWLSSRIFLGCRKRKRDASRKSSVRLNATSDPKCVLGLMGQLPLISHLFGWGINNRPLQPRYLPGIFKLS